MNNYKFRGKTKDEKWVYGNIFDDSFSDFIKSVLPETVGQWMGLLDKNGKEIYYGDILKIPPQKEGNKNGLVFCTWGIEQDVFGCIGFNLTYNPDLRSGGVVVSKSFEYEVIGNIHDNPELLEVE